MGTKVPRMSNAAKQKVNIFLAMIFIHFPIIE